jgi:HK97 family phage prohead protease
MTAQLTVAAQWKAVPGDGGELDGYASVFGNVDQGGDVVLPGAFKASLAEWARSSQPMPLIADHDLSTEGVIGSVVSAQEDNYGLRIRARFSRVPKAQAIRAKMIEGHLKGMSFTYDTVRHYMGMAGGKAVRFLQEVKVFEASVTPFPMNALALASAKGPATGVWGHVAGATVPVVGLYDSIQAIAEHRQDTHPDRQRDNARIAAAAWIPKTLPRELQLQLLDGLDAIRGKAIAAAAHGEAEALRQARWEQDNAYSNGLAATMARLRSAR